MRIAHDIVIDHVKHEVRIEGVVFPFHVERWPEVDSDSGFIGVVRLGIFADNVTLITQDGVEFVNAAADELAWARAMAREAVAVEMAPVLAWLKASA